MDGVIASLRRHVSALWPGHGWLLAVPLIAWGVFRLLQGEARVEHILLFFIVVPLLAFTNQTTKRLFTGLYPLAILGIAYDSMYLVKNLGLTPERVHSCDLQALDARFFGVTVDGVRVSVHEWLQPHASPALDVLCAIPYGTFIYASIAFAVFLYVRDDAAMRRFGWTFLTVNLMGFVTYHLYPAAPPWYVHAHGCVADLAARASEGPNLARVDAWMGFPYFASFYGRSNDVFGAVPSLHVTYPLLVALYGYRHFGVALRTASIGYFLAMCFAAVYLDHHWVADVVLGILYTVVIEVAQARLRTWHASRSRRSALIDAPTQ